mgnify:CR=1 FL=1
MVKAKEGGWPPKDKVGASPLKSLNSILHGTRLRRNVGRNGHNFRKNGVTRFFS